MCTIWDPRRIQLPRVFQAHLLEQLAAPRAAGAHEARARDDGAIPELHPGDPPSRQIHPHHFSAEPNLDALQACAADQVGQDVHRVHEAGVEFQNKWEPPP